MLGQNIFFLLTLTIGLINADNNEILRFQGGPSLTQDKILQANVNKLIDENIAVLQNALSSADPTPVPDFSKNIYVSHFTFTNGTLNNLSKVYRSTSSYITYDNEELIFNFNLGWDYLDIKYHMEWANFGTCIGDYKATLSNVRANLVLVMNLNNYVVILKNFSFYDTSSISGSVKSTPFCQASSPLFNLVTKIMKGKILTEIQTGFTTKIQHAIENLNKLIGSPKNKNFTFVNLVDNKQYDEI